MKEAAIHLGSIVAEGSQKVSTTFWNASKGAARGCDRKGRRSGQRGRLHHEEDPVQSWETV